MFLALKKTVISLDPGISECSLHLLYFQEMEFVIAVHALYRLLTKNCLYNFSKWLTIDLSKILCHTTDTAVSTLVILLKKIIFC